MAKVLWIQPLNTEASFQFKDENSLFSHITFPEGIENIPTALLAGDVDCVVIVGSPHRIDGVESLELIHRFDRTLPVIFWDAEMSAGEAARLARAGAFDCLGYRNGFEDVKQSLQRAVAQVGSAKGRRKNAGTEHWRKPMVGASDAMETVAETVRLVGPRRCTVLITGESGTGKEVVARAIHQASPRAGRPLVAVNCAALPDNLLEAELFGYVKGAFTGATSARIGRFEQADQGTIFLDEIGEMPIELQTKLLRVLQEREVQRLGGSETIKVDIRVITATNRDLLEGVRQGRFREDLYYRLNVVPLQMPPLRKRCSDIPQLVHHFVEKVCHAEGIPVKKVAPEAIEAMKAKSWPGNIRQLENTVEMAVALSGARDILTLGDFGCFDSKLTTVMTTAVSAADCGFYGGDDFDSAVSRFKQSIINQALERSNGNKTAAAELLGLKRTTLIMKLRSMESTSMLPAG